MAPLEQILEYKCPCCGAGLHFDGTEQKLTCQYCDNTFDLEAIQAYNEEGSTRTDHWKASANQGWSSDEDPSVVTYSCPSCGGELMTEETTAATFCPYCGNPTVLPGRLSDGIRPDAIVPFRTTLEDAKAAFLKLCKGKPLLPKEFMAEHRLEKISGIYVPFWLYDCKSGFDARYAATRVHHWSDAHYRYTRTEHFLLMRSADACFAHIPMDASAKMDDAIMESIEPYDFSAMVDFDTAYLTGFLADKYDVEAQTGYDRVRERVDHSMNDLIAPTLIGYATAIPSHRNVHVEQGESKYVLLPVWMLHTKYRDKSYVFAMNGQTGKMTGTFPICPKRSWAWFGGICGAVTALAALLQWMIL